MRQRHCLRECEGPQKVFEDLMPSYFDLNPNRIVLLKCGVDLHWICVNLNPVFYSIYSLYDLFPIFSTVSWRCLT